MWKNVRSVSITQEQNHTGYNEDLDYDGQEGQKYGQKKITISQEERGKQQGNKQLTLKENILK